MKERLGRPPSEKTTGSHTEKEGGMWFAMRPMRLPVLTVFVATLLGTGCGSVGSSPPDGRPVSLMGAPRQGKPSAASVVIVIMENRDADLIIGSPHAPYINGTLVPQAALMTNSHAIGHPSQPNYIALFSGSTQGITDDSCPHTFKSQNLGAELISSGSTFDGYSESMPNNGYKGCSTNLYARKHNPWVDFSNVRSSANVVWHGYPKVPPTVSIVVPNICNDMHDCSTKTGDDWLKANLPSILQYDANAGGLLILTWDEAAPDHDGKNTVATLLIGPMVTPGRYSQWIDHYAVLRTVEQIAGVPCTANACKSPLIKAIWK